MTYWSICGDRYRHKLVSDAEEEEVSEGISAREGNYHLILYRTTFKHDWEDMLAMIAK